MYFQVFVILQLSQNSLRLLEMWDSILKNEEKIGKLTETAFKAIDMNGNGAIQFNELEEIMRSTAEDMGIERPSKE